MTRWWKMHRLRRRLKRPTPALVSVVRRLHAHLDAAQADALALVEIGTAEPAAVSIAVLASMVSSEGKGVILVDAAEDRPLCGMLRPKGDPACVRRVSVRGQSVGLYVAPADPTGTGRETVGEEADVTLVLATVDPAVGADHLAAWARDAIVMVRAGKATRSHIDGIASHLRHARIAILSGMLIGTDREDHSSGVPPARDFSAESAQRLPEALRDSTDYVEPAARATSP